MARVVRASNRTPSRSSSRARALLTADGVMPSDRAAEAKKRDVRVEYAIPQEGSLLSNDVWAIPADARNVDAAHKFVDFMLRPEIAALNSDAVGYPNPVPASRPLVKPEVRDDPTVFVPEEVRARLYTITPAAREYERLRTRAWTRVTAGR